MANRSSYMLAVLLIANPFMLLFFQNCSAQSNARSIASTESAVIVEVEKPAEVDLKKAEH